MSAGAEAGICRKCGWGHLLARPCITDLLDGHITPDQMAVLVLARLDTDEPVTLGAPQALRNSVLAVLGAAYDLGYSHGWEIGVDERQRYATVRSRNPWRQP